MLRRTIRKIKWLFRKQPVYTQYHIPATHLTPQYYDTIHADVKFKPHEKIQIEKAVDEWNLFFNGLVELELKFDLTDDNKDSFRNDSLMYRVKRSDFIIKVYEELYKSKIIGLCVFIRQNKRPAVYLAHTELKTDLEWKIVTMHELGHLVGLGHINVPGVMNKHYNQAHLHLNRADAEEVSRIYGVDPEDFVYAINV